MQGYLQKYLGAKTEVRSAGLEKHGVHPFAIGIMAEDDIDISKHSSNLIEEYSDKEFSHVLTVCDHAHEQCPIFPAGVSQLHKNFNDPTKMSGSVTTLVEAFRQTRDEIKSYSKEFVEQLDSLEQGSTE